MVFQKTTSMNLSRPFRVRAVAGDHRGALRRAHRKQVSRVAPRDVVDVALSPIALDHGRFLHTPEVHRTVQAPTGHVLAARREGEAAQSPLVPPEGRPHFFLFYIPKLHGRVKRCRREEVRRVALGRSPLQREDLAIVPAKVGHAVDLAQAPDLHGVVVRAAGQKRAAGLPSNGVHLVLVAKEGGVRGGAADTIHHHRSIHAAGGELVVRSPVGVQHGALVMLEHLHHVSRGAVPKHRRLVVLSVRRPLQRHDVASGRICHFLRRLQAVELPQLWKGAQVPDPHLRSGATHAQEIVLWAPRRAHH
eukprot:scaffold374_cov271-Pinguiococcus_pyrenoidosus.AAC.1